MRGGDQYIPLDLIVSCEHPEATALFDWLHWAVQSARGALLYAGWDMARVSDKSICWIVELLGWMKIPVGDGNQKQVPIVRTVGLLDWSKMPFPEQKSEARRLMPYVQRLAMDATGMGGPYAEELTLEFPGKVEGVVMTIEAKESLAVNGKRAMEEQRLLLPPDNREIRAGFQSLKRYQAATKHMRVDAGHSKAGHGDEAWAAWLALAAVSEGSYVPASWGGVIGRPVMSDLAMEMQAA
jgi:phage FluMu gp28-like protein